MMIVLAFGVLGFFLGGYYFFHPLTPLQELFSEEYKGGAYWYRNFSINIFDPQQIYLAESILFPLLAKILGANSSIASWQILNSFFFLLLMPVISIVIAIQVKNKILAFIGVLLVASTFPYLSNYLLGFPDPLTMLFLILIIPSKKFMAVFFGFLAGVTHFSTAALALVALSGLKIVSKNANRKFYYVTPELIGLFISKAFLITWNFIFSYQLESRFDWVLKQGLEYFLKRYHENEIGFWITPGISFLALNCFLFVFLSLVDMPSLLYFMFFHLSLHTLPFF